MMWIFLIPTIVFAVGATAAIVARRLNRGNSGSSSIGTAPAAGGATGGAPAAGGTTTPAVKAKTEVVTGFTFGKFLAAVIALAIGNGLVYMIVYKLQLAGAQFDLWNLFLGLNMCLAIPIALSFTSVPNGVKWLIGFLAIVVGLPVMVSLNTAVPRDMRGTTADASAEVIDLRGKSGITTLFVLPGQRSAWYRFNPGVDFKISHGETRLRVYTQGVWKAGVEEGPGQNLPAPENSKYDEKDRTFSFLGVEKVPVEVTLRWEPAK